MERSFGDAYRSLHDRHWWWRARERFVLDRVGELASRREGGRFGGILDVGCGDALLFPELERFGEPEGIEPDEELVSAASAARWHVHRGFLDASFVPRTPPGLVLLLDVIEHADDDVALLARAREILQPGGDVIVTVPAGPRLWTSHDDLNHHRRRYVPSSLRASLEAAGLRVESVRPFFHWLVAAKLAIVAKERLLGAVPSVPRVPPEPLNTLLWRACLAEQALTRHLVPPWGSSLLAVARAPAARP